MEQNNKHRLAKVAKEFGVGVSTLLEFFEKNGVSGLTPNSKIDEDLYQKALKKYGNDKLIKEQILKQKQLEAEKKQTAKLEEEEAKAAAEREAIENKKIVEQEEKEKAALKQKNDDEKKLDVVEKVEDKTDDNKKEEKKEVANEKLIDGPKVLGKMDLSTVEKKKFPKKKPNKNNKTVDKSKVDDNKKTDTAKVVEKTSAPKKEQNVQKKEEDLDKTKIVEVKKDSDKKVSEKVDEKDTVKKVEPEKTDEAKSTKDNVEKVADSGEPKHIKDDVEKLKGPTVVGKIDLTSMNLKTRPDKKTKKEKEDERKKRQQGQNKGKKTNNRNKNNQNRNKKKNGPRVEKVEISKEGAIIGKKTKGKQRIKRKKKEPEVASEIDVQKQVRETLQKLEQRQKSNSAKFRKVKRKEHQKRVDKQLEKEAIEGRIIKLTEFITVKELSDLMSIEPVKIIEFCFDLGQPVTINFRIDSELINMITEEFGFEVEYVQSSFEEEVEQMLNDESNQVDLRPPIITVMGHVDHGKTSLLDYIRKTNVMGGESGGITQHIGSYSVLLDKTKKITFIDTPGHEAFTAMRARGTKVTDIAVIVIAADDSIMPQTEEAIDHARAADVPMIFAINKIDKNGADPERIKQQLAEKNLLIEDWGGKYGCVEISAKKGLNIDTLLERIWLEAEMLELKGNADRPAIATVLEAQLDKGRGYISNIIVRTGTLQVGSIVVAGGYYGKVKALYNEFDKKVKSVGPSAPIQILGLNGAPEPGDPLVVMPSEKEARDKAEQRLQIIRELEMRARKKHSLEELSRRFAEGDKLDLHFIVKADVKGSADAITDQIQRLSNDEVEVTSIRSAVGQISDNDIMLAAASGTIVIGFNVRPSVSARRLAEKKNIEIRLYSIIYDIINDVKSTVHGMLAPIFKEEILGSAEVLNIFKITKLGTIAGSIVRDGKFTQNDKARVIRDGVVVYTGKLSSLKRFKDDVKEVLKGYECGIGIENYNDIKDGDFIEVFKEVEVERTLD